MLTPRTQNRLPFAQGFSCGMTNRSASQLVSLRDRDIIPVFASVSCGGLETDLFNCDPFRLSTTCESGSGASVVCLEETDDDFNLCKLLQGTSLIFEKEREPSVNV